MPRWKEWRCRLSSHKHITTKFVIIVKHFQHVISNSLVFNARFVKWVLLKITCLTDFLNSQLKKAFPARRAVSKHFRLFIKHFISILIYSFHFNILAWSHFDSFSHVDSLISFLSFDTFVFNSPIQFPFFSAISRFCL